MEEFFFFPKVITHIEQNTIEMEFHKNKSTEQKY